MLTIDHESVESVDEVLRVSIAVLYVLGEPQLIAIE